MSKFDFDEWLNQPINRDFDWSVEAQIKARARRQATKKRGAAIINLPQQQAPPPVGAVGRLTPTAYEASILRRAARGFILVTMRGGGTLYTFEDGTPIRDEKTHKPLDKRGFVRLSRFLVPERRDALFDGGTAQRWNTRRLP